MRIAVTGANGLVGSRLCRLLVERGHNVTGFSRGPSRTSGGFAYVSCELTDAAAVKTALTASGAEAVVHTASMTDVDACEREPGAAWAANVDAAAAVAATCKTLGAHLVHVSTDYVFDGDHGPYRETDLPNPRGAYARSKLGGELAAQTLSNSWAIARTAVVYGWPQASRPNFGSWLATALSSGKKVNLFRDQHVSPSLADSVASMLAELAERRLPGIWNTAGAEVVDRVTYGQKLCALLGFDEGLINATRLADAKLASPRPQSCGLSPAKATRELAAKPLSLDASLARFAEAWRQVDPAVGPK